MLDKVEIGDLNIQIMLESSLFIIRGLHCIMTKISIRTGKMLTPTYCHRRWCDIIGRWDEQNLSLSVGDFSKLHETEGQQLII